MGLDPMTDHENIQWYPGHMTKTRRMIEADIKLVDAVMEVLDARLPLSSKNPMTDELTAGKTRLLVLNKVDLADPTVTMEWAQHFKNQHGLPSIELNAQNGKGVDALAPTLRRLLADRLERNAKRGMNKQLRVMVLGIPNVGKSSLLNRLARTAKTKVADRPGVTRGKQWITMGGGIDLLDTPGILWPKFEDRNVSLRLAFTGAIKDDVLDVEDIAIALLHWLACHESAALVARYPVSTPLSTDGVVLLQQVGSVRNLLMKGGEVDLRRTASILLDEFRAGKLGRISLERPESASCL